MGNGTDSADITRASAYVGDASSPFDTPTATHDTAESTATDATDGTQSVRDPLFTLPRDEKEFQQSLKPRVDVKADADKVSTILDGVAVLASLLG